MAFLSKGNILKNMAVLLGAVMFFSCSNDLEKVKALELDTSAPEMMEDFELNYTEGGMVRARLKGGVMEHHYGKDPRVEVSDGLEMEFMDKWGRPESQLQSRYGVLHETDNLMEVKYNVIFKNLLTGEELRTEHLIWEPTNDTAPIFIPPTEFVKVKQEGGNIMRGYGLVANEEFTWWRINKLSGEITLEKEEDD